MAPFPSFREGIDSWPAISGVGTVNLLLLRVLAVGRMHGYGIAHRLKQGCGDVLQVGGSSLYLALQRLLANGWVKAEWGF